MGFKRNDVEHWFVEAGLKEVKVGCAGEDCCARSDCRDEHARIGIFMAIGRK
jgi:hypothetical protein